MIAIQDLHCVIGDLVFSKCHSIDIILPYQAKKKDVGPKLAKLLKDAGVPRISSTPQEWIVMTDQGRKAINFITTVNNKKNSCVIIIPDDREDE